MRKSASTHSFKDCVYRFFLDGNRLALYAVDLQHGAGNDTEFVSNHLLNGDLTFLGNDRFPTSSV